MGDSLAIVAVYVDDDLLIIGFEEELVNQTKGRISNGLKTKNFGPVNRFLGFEVKKDLDRQQTFISSQQYIRKTPHQWMLKLLSLVSILWSTLSNMILRVL